MNTYEKCRTLDIYYDHWGKENLRRRRSQWCCQLLMKQLEQVWFDVITPQYEFEEDSHHSNPRNLYQHIKTNIVVYNEVMMDDWTGSFHEKPHQLVMMKLIADGLYPSLLPFEEDIADRRVISHHHGNVWAHEYMSCRHYIRAFCKLHDIPTWYLEYSEGISDSLLHPREYKEMLRRVNAIVALST